MIIDIPAEYEFTKQDEKILHISESQRANFHRHYCFDLIAMTDKQIDHLESILKKIVDQTAGVHLNGRDRREVQFDLGTIKRWRDSKAGKFPRATNARSGEQILSQYIAQYATGCKLYKCIEQRWYPLFVSCISFHHKDERSEDLCSVQYEFNCLDERRTHAAYFSDSECRGKTAPALLATKGLFVASDEILNEVSRARRRLEEVAKNVGKQYWLNGPGFGRRDAESSLSGTDCFKCASPTSINGGPVNVVIDNVDDEEELPRSMDMTVQRMNNYRLTELRQRLKDKLPIAADYLAPEDDCGDEEYGYPIHPLVPVFDLVRHQRYAVHVMDLVEYKYDTSMVDKLILPEPQKDILGKLAKTRGNEFKDIVAGKSGGSIILLAGKPGLGKTLSAEVYSEVSQRPLYRVQCSQLGIDSTEIESTFVDIFRRSNRWDAIVLIDEADLYISERGQDINRNAIVCVFLRTLETVNGVLFLTTNKPESVDDAIASRCIARFDVSHPDKDSARKIWQTLRDSSGVQISDDVIETMLNEFPKMGGRDIKQTIKLAMTTGTGEITADRLRFCLSFHPNRGAFASI